MHTLNINDNTLGNVSMVLMLCEIITYVLNHITLISLNFNYIEVTKKSWKFIVNHGQKINPRYLILRAIIADF